MNRIKHKILSSILLMLIMLCCFTGCYINNRRSRAPGAPQFHKGYEEYEAVIYNELQNYISLGEPKYYSEQNKISIVVSFWEWYYESEDAMSEHPMYEVIDRFMYLFNQFLRENPDYFNVDGVRYYISFGYETFTHFEIVAELMNCTSKIKSDYLCAVEYRHFKDYSKLTCKDDIEYVYIHSYPSDIDSASEYADYVCEVISLFPNLKEINFNGGLFDWDEISEEVSFRYPDIIIGS